jgi:dihydroneopterin aldolase
VYRVFIEDLEFYSYHGVSGEERLVGHRYMASVSLDVDGQATTTDAIAHTVDYGAAGDVIQRVASSKQFSTVERLADEICRELLSRFRSVQEVRLKVVKRLPPAPMIVREAGVEMVMSREQL